MPYCGKPVSLVQLASDDERRVRELVKELKSILHAGRTGDKNEAPLVEDFEKKLINDYSVRFPRNLPASEDRRFDKSKVSR